jgi:hypothetical protein
MDRKQLLLVSLRVKDSINKLLDQTDRSEQKDEAVFQVMGCVPCILHCKNCVGLKIFSMVLSEGLSNAKEALTYVDIISEDKALWHLSWKWKL